MSQQQPTIVLFCGLPGSGKTTAAKRLETELPGIRLCPDEWMADLGVDLFDEEIRTRLEISLWDLALQLLKQGQNVILENGLWTKHERDQKRNDLKEIDARIEFVYLDVPFETLLQRIEKRNALGGHGIVTISRDQLEAYFEVFEPPETEELQSFGI